MEAGIHIKSEFDGAFGVWSIEMVFDTHLVSITLFARLHGVGVRDSHEIVILSKMN